MAQSDSNSNTLQLTDQKERSQLPITVHIVGPKTLDARKAENHDSRTIDNTSNRGSRSVNTAARDLMKKYLGVHSKEKRNLHYNQQVLDSFAKESNLSGHAHGGGSTIQFGSKRTKYDVR